MNPVLEQIARTGAVAILRLRAHDRAVEVAHALAAAELGVMELTLDHPAALGALEAVAAAVPEGVLLGAGTVRTAEQVEQAAAAGARFCVSPNVDPDVIREALAQGLEPLPGTFTATEVATALDAGARAVKVFPAGPVGPAYLRALKGPFEDALLIPTGGIRHDAVGEWLTAGAVAVGLGSDLVPSRPRAEDVTAIGARAAVVVAQVAPARRDRS